MTYELPGRCTMARRDARSKRLQELRSLLYRNPQGLSLEEIMAAVKGSRFTIAHELLQLGACLGLFGCWTLRPGEDEIAFLEAARKAAPGLISKL